MMKPACFFSEFILVSYLGTSAITFFTLGCEIVVFIAYVCMVIYFIPKVCS